MLIAHDYCVIYTIFCNFHKMLSIVQYIELELLELYWYYYIILELYWYYVRCLIMKYIFFLPRSIGKK